MDLTLESSSMQCYKVLLRETPAQLLWFNCCFGHRNQADTRSAERDSMLCCDKINLLCFA